MLARCAAVVIAFVFAALVAAPGGASMVCRYTGRSFDPCDCPMAKAQQGCSFEDPGCCELRVSERASFSGLVSPENERNLSLTLVVGIPSLAAPRVRLLESHGLPLQRPKGDPGDPKYLRLRQLLI